MRWRDVREELLSSPGVSRALVEEFPYQPVADAILDVRAQFHLTQAELAERIGTSQSAVARAESGKHPIEVSLLRRISQSFGLEYKIIFAQPQLDSHAPQPTSSSSR